MSDDLEIIKLFDKNIKKFVYKEIDWLDGKEKIFETFEDFVKFLDGDISNSDLFDYDFKGVDLKKYDIKNAGISSSVLIEQNLYDSSFYDDNVGVISDSSICTSTESQELTTEHSNFLMDNETLKWSKDNIIYYVTDLHLNHKIMKKFPNHASEYEIRMYLREVSEGIGVDFGGYGQKYLLIGGDVSYNFNISRMFYEELVKVIRPYRIIVVMGNHELWDYGNNHGRLHGGKASLENIILDYREMFRTLGITLLQNELFTFSGDKIQSWNYLDLCEKSVDEVRDICLTSRLTILGGIGFSGYNELFNANDGIYRETIDNLNDELIQTKRFEKLYSVVESALSDLSVIVLTHMPKESWTLRPYNKNWVYVSGHTHRNYCCVDADRVIYSDNQVGYHNTSIRLKYFLVENEYDLFRYYHDGIYEINRNTYINFCHGQSISMQFNRKDCTIYMLKNSGTYCFLLRNHKNGNLFFLNGGQIKSIEKQDLHYYYDNLKLYSDAVNDFMQNYNKSLEELSKAVKAIGGSGNIHGCIVDIDFFNHLYLNPLDGKITPYYATDITYKIVYKNLLSLLYAEKKDIYDNYMRQIEQGKKISNLISLDGDEKKIIEKTEVVCDTDIYRISRIFRGLQYTTNNNVVRIWNDKLIELNEKERSARIMYDMIESKK